MEREDVKLALELLVNVDELNDLYAEPAVWVSRVSANKKKNLSHAPVE